MATDVVGKGEEGPDNPATSRFTDRVMESEALLESLKVHRSAIDAGAIDGKSMNNVLVFYGFGGVGKSALSRKLEQWISGGQGCAHWGPSPQDMNAVPVRWDLRDTEVLKNPVLFHLRLSEAFEKAEVRAPLFDIGVIAAVVKLNCRHSGEQNELLARVPERAEQLLQDLAPRISSADLGVSPERFLVDLLLKEKTERFPQCPHLSETLSVIMDGEADVEHMRVVAILLGRLLTEDLKGTRPESRPLPVVFVDTFEMLDQRGNSGDEQVVNAIVGSLPQCLFVITGRTRVKWDEEDFSLDYSGPEVWPSLARTHEGQEEPRQHLVGSLAESDAYDLLKSYLTNIGAPVSDAVCASLSRKVRLPIHIDAIRHLARRFALRNPGVALTAEDLSGDLKSVVERIMERCSAEEAQLLQAAAISDQFDAPLLAAMASVSVAVAERFMGSPLVQRVEGQQFFPFHLHDEVRALVRNAGHRVRHAWNTADRVSAAVRGLEQLAEQHRQAVERDLLTERILVHVTAYHICRRYDLMEPWVVQELLRTPSNRRLRQYLGRVDKMDDLLSEAAAFSGILSYSPVNRLPELMRFMAECSSDWLRRRAELWVAYTLRAQRRYGDALVALERLWCENQNVLHGEEILITKRMMRRYRDVVAGCLRLGKGAGMPLGGVFRAHGLVNVAKEYAERRLERDKGLMKPRRWLAELSIILMDYKGFLGVLSEEELCSVKDLGESLDRNDARACYWRWMGLWNLFDDSLVQAAWSALVMIKHEVGDLTTGAKRSLRFLAGMRLLACGDDAYLNELQGLFDVTEDLRNHEGEFLFEYLKSLGRAELELVTPETQWVGSREVAKQRWIAIFNRLVEEARARKESA